MWVEYWCLLHLYESYGAHEDKQEHDVPKEEVNTFKNVVMNKFLILSQSVIAKLKDPLMIKKMLFINGISSV